MSGSPSYANLCCLVNLAAFCHALAWFPTVAKMPLLTGQTTCRVLPAWSVSAGDVSQGLSTAFWYVVSFSGRLEPIYTSSRREAGSGASQML